MDYYKYSHDGYIVAIGTGGMGTKITVEEYRQIESAINSRPLQIGMMDYRLREDLTWEAYEIEPPEPEEDELTDDEALAIILGGAT